MTATLFAAPSMVCARCDGSMVITTDAIGRERRRCPRCDRVAPRVTVHPDEVLVPQTLVRLTASALPPVAPGQLRCQVCAKGVEGRKRFCVACTAAMTRRGTNQARVYQPKACFECGEIFQPSGPRSRYCERCR